MATNFTNSSISAISLHNQKYHLKGIPFHGTEAEWNEINYTPKAGEIIIYDADELNNNSRLKIGNGESLVKDLDFVNSETVDDVNGVVPITKGGTGATDAASALINLGLTATATELNYMDGVTSNVQNQINKRQIATITSGSADDIYEYLTLRDIRTNNTELYNMFAAGGTKGENYAYIVTLFLSNTNEGASRVQIAVGYTNAYIATRAYYGTTGWKPWNMMMSSILHPYFTGTSLPTAGIKNRIFFKTE